MHSLFVVGFFAALAGFVWLSVLERNFHRLMHHPRPGIAKLFAGHLRHHERFSVGGPYRFEEGQSTNVIIVDNFIHGVYLVVLSMIPFLLVGAILMLLNFWYEAYVILIVGLVDTMIYYAMMEYVHWISHAPASKAPQSGLLYRLSEYHHRHHDDGEINLNVAFPLADWLSERQAQTEASDTAQSST